MIENTKQVKKSLRNILFIMLMGLVGMTQANPVDMQTVCEVAVKFMNANARTPLRGAEDLHLVTTYRTESDDAAFHIFNTPNGFVIVSADDCTTPILGYSDEGRPFNLDNIPIQLQDYLQGFVEQIQYGIENHIEADEQTTRQWTLVRVTGRLTENRSTEAVTPLLTSLWDQGCYYNAMCPEDEGPCNHVLTGCVATAMAQIMYYWRCPNSGMGSHTYSLTNYPTQTVDFSATTYNWVDMPNSLSYASTPTQINAVATLMWHCGVAVDMNYGSDGSFAYSQRVATALVNYFGYSNEMSYESQDSFTNPSECYTNSSWRAKLKDCLDLGRPVYYSGRNPNSFGHAFVCDGYDNSDLFHINWGWEGSDDGYYVIGALPNFNTDYQAIFNIHPQGDTTNHIISVSANNEEGGIVSGGGTFSHGASVTLSAISTNGYNFRCWVENGGIASFDPNYSFTATFNRNLVAVFTEPYTVTVLHEEGGKAYGGGTFEYGLQCNLTAIPDEGFCFGYWSENGQVASYDPFYSFVVTGERLLVAHFVLSENNIDFVDFNVKVICLNAWDTNYDGALSYDEAAEVEYLGEFFRGNTEITSFDELYYFTNLMSIDDEAFYGCSNLTRLTLPNSVTSIGNNAFFGCSLIGPMIIPSSVIMIGDRAFYNCSGLTGHLTIPSSVTTIGDRAFYGCSGFSGPLTIPGSVTWIGSFAFFGCSGLTGALTIPESITTINNNAFSYCSGLTSVCFPNSVTSIGDAAFFNCYRLAGPLIIPNSVTSIGYEAFNYCGDLSPLITFAEIPPLIGNSAFFGNYYTTPLYVPCESVETYQTVEGWSAFNQIVGMCSSEIITVSTNTPEWGDVTGGGDYEVGSFCTLIAISNEGYGFAYWTENGNVVSNDAIYSFVVTGERQLTAHFVLLEGNIEFIDDQVKEICIWLWDSNFDGELSYEEAAAVTNLYGSFRIMDITSFDELQYFTGLLSIEESEFFGCRYLTSITLPNSVTSIGESAFSYCESLESIFIPKSVTSVGLGVFNGCNSLQQIIVHPNNTVFDSRNGCNAIIETNTNTLKIGCKSTVIPNSVTSIGEFAFNVCIGLGGNLTIPNSVTTIGDYAFNSCNGISGLLTIPDSVISIGEASFRYCNRITAVAIGNSLTSIGDNAFGDCNGLTAVYYSGDITQWCNILFGDNGSNPLTFAHNLYLNNTLLTELVIPETMTSINQYAFNNATCLTGSLTLPNSVTTIESNAFSGCSGLISLTLPNSVTLLGSSVFSRCSGLTSLTIPNSVTTIGNFAFYGCSGLSEVMLLGSTPPTLGYYSFYGSVCPIYVPYESLNDYKTATNWSNYENRIFPMAYSTILGYGNDTDGWAFIASPLVESTVPSAVDNMVAIQNYDLYRFNQSAEREWENSKAINGDEESFLLANGQGYLYASDEDVNLFFKGSFNENESEEIGLAYDGNASFSGWNLVGNPFPVKAFADRSYYVMNEDGTAIEPVAVSSSTAVNPCTGIMVKAEASGETVTFARTAAKTTSSRGNLQITVSEAPSEAVVDKAILSFTPGDELEKYVFNKNASQLYLQQDGKDYAVTCANGAGELPICFKASQDGSYTLRINKANKEFTYLHLIDTVNGVDVDLLQQPSYSFESTTADLTNRFKLIFK